MDLPQKPTMLAHLEAPRQDHMKFLDRQAKLTHLSQEPASCSPDFPGSLKGRIEHPRSPVGLVGDIK